MSLDFLMAFIRAPMRTGAIAPSSTALARQMLEFIPESPGSLVVEYGPGSGSFTRRIVERRSLGSFLAIEINPTFVERLKESLPGVEVHQGSVEDVRGILDSRGLGKADLVVSGLPWAVFGEDLQKRIMSATRDILNDGGVFSTFAYVHCLWFPSARRFAGLLRETFPAVVTSSVVWKNLPPALVYHCFKNARAVRHPGQPPISKSPRS